MFDRLFEQYGKDAYQFRENTILVTIPFRWIHVVDNGNAPEEIKQDGLNFAKMNGNEADTGNLLGKLPNKLPSNLPNKLKATYEAILTNNRATNLKLAAMTNQSERTIRNHTNELKKIGYINRVGPPKSGYWEVLETD